MTPINKIVIAVLATLTLQSLTLAQARFGVASIRPNPDRRDPSFVINPGGIIYARVSLQDCIDAHMA